MLMKKIKTNLINLKHRTPVLELISMLKEHSKETYVHSVDVAEKSFALANALGIRGEYLERLYTASLLHDIGKICVPQELLHKNDATEEEADMIRVIHINGTREILEGYFEEELVNLASHHHERLNCSGYPSHLNATKLNMLDRILQVADVTSALEMSRSYKEAYPTEVVIKILEDLVHRGELDKRCVKEIEKIFLKPLKEKSQMS